MVRNTRRHRESIYKMNEYKKGFTLIELLVVISIMGTLASIVLVSINSARAKGRDAYRVGSLKSFSTALELFYDSHQRFPCFEEPCTASGGFGFWNFRYAPMNADGTCGAEYSDGSGDLRFDNSSSVGFIEPLFQEGLITVSEWSDPLNPDLGSIYNCRYVVPGSEFNNRNIQHYLLHCNLENSSMLEAGDGGTNDTLYEIIGGGPWICVLGNYP